MRKIEFYHSIFTPEDTNVMANQLVLIIETSGNEDNNLVLAKEALKTTNLKLTNVLNSFKSNPFTKSLKERDTFRDSTYRGGRDVVEGMTYWVFDTEKQEAAMRTKEIFVRHGWDLYRYSYSDESSALNSFIEELKKEENQKDLATMSLMDWFQSLVQSQQDFEKVFNDKSSYDSNKESAVKREAQIPTNEAIEKLVIYLNSIILFNENVESWKKLYNDVEGIIKQSSTRARARRNNGGDKPAEE